MKSKAIFHLSLKAISGGNGTCTYTKNGDPQSATDVKDKSECDKFQTEYNNAVKFIYVENEQTDDKPNTDNAIDDAAKE